MEQTAGNMDFKYDTKEAIAFKLLEDFVTRYQTLYDAIGRYLSFLPHLNKNFKTDQMRAVEFELITQIKSNLSPVVHMLDTITAEMDDEEVKQNVAQLLTINRQVMESESIKPEQLEKIRMLLAKTVAKVLLSNVMIAPQRRSKVGMLGDYEVV